MRRGRASGVSLEGASVHRELGSKEPRGDRELRIVKKQGAPVQEQGEDVSMQARRDQVCSGKSPRTGQEFSWRKRDRRRERPSGRMTRL